MRRHGGCGGPLWAFESDDPRWVSLVVKVVCTFSCMLRLISFAVN